MSVGHEAERWDQRGEEEIKSTPLHFHPLSQFPHHTSPYSLSTEIITLPFHRVTISSVQGPSSPAKLPLFWIME